MPHTRYLAPEDEVPQRNPGRLLPLAHVGAEEVRRHGDAKGRQPRQGVAERVLQGEEEEARNVLETVVLYCIRIYLVLVTNSTYCKRKHFKSNINVLFCSGSLCQN